MCVLSIAHLCSSRAICWELPIITHFFFPPPRDNLWRRYLSTLSPSCWANYSSVWGFWKLWMSLWCWNQHSPISRNVECVPGLVCSKELFKNKTKRIPWVWIVKSSRMCGIACVKYLGQWAPPGSWSLLPEQVQNKYLGKACTYPVNSRQTQVTEMCWGLAHTYWSVFNTLQHLKGTRWPGSDGKALCTATTSTPVTRTAAEPETQPMPVSVTPIDKKKWTQKSAQ